MTDSVDSTRFLSELGITISRVVEPTNVYYSRLKIIREIVLAVLGSELKSRPSSKICCVDAPSKNGLAGMQWKKHFSDAVHVTIGTKESLQDFQSTSSLNDLKVNKMSPSFDRIPGDEPSHQSMDELHVACCEASVLLHMESYDFVYLNPHGDLISLLQPALTNTPNNGLLCLVSTDTCHQFARSGLSVKRHFGATVMKTEYLKEMAGRVLLGTVARTAGICNKGIEVLCTLYLEDVFLIVVRVLRGPKCADACLENIKQLLHCQICQERIFLSNTLAPLEEPYKQLPCKCNDNTPGKTGAVLGPLWSGDLFNSQFLKKTLESAKELRLSKKSLKLLTAIDEESHCLRNSSKCKCQDISNKGIHMPDSTENSGEPDFKKQRMESLECLQMPVFYCNIHRLQMKETNLPKIDKAVLWLQEAGFCARKTHFDPHCIRTNAPLNFVKEILVKKCDKN